MTNDERIEQLERQVAELKQQNVSARKEQHKRHLAEKFGVEDDNPILVHTIDHLDPDAGEEVAEQSFITNCQRAGVPSNDSQRVIASYMEKMKARQQDDEEYRNQIENSFAQ